MTLPRGVRPSVLSFVLAGGGNVRGWCHRGGGEQNGDGAV